ncbi:hypothetical protein BH11CYA1_BH11CYA1_02140 [soil metagenome]
MSKKEKKTSNPERLVLALIENAHFEESLVLLDDLEKSESSGMSKTIWLYARALATFGLAHSKSSEPDLKPANAILHQAFTCNNFVLPLMVSRVNEVSNKIKSPKISKSSNSNKMSAYAAKGGKATAQGEAAKYIDLWFGSWLQTENAFDWLGNQFVEWTRVTREARLRAQQEQMIANAQKLDIDFFLN